MATSLFRNGNFPISQWQLPYFAMATSLFRNANFPISQWQLPYFAMATSLFRNVNFLILQCQLPFINFLMLTSLFHVHSHAGSPLNSGLGVSSRGILLPIWTEL